MKSKIHLLLLTLLLALPIAAATYTADDVPNVHRIDRERFVSDPDNLLSDGTRRTVDQRLRALMDTTTAEVSYVILGSIGDKDIYDFTQELASKWGVGKKDKSNGLMVVIVMDQRKIRIHTGQGMEGILPDITSKHIIDEDMVPAMRDNNLDEAIDKSSKHIANIIGNKENAAEIESEIDNDRERELDSTFHTLLLIIAFCSLFFSLCMVINKVMKCKGATNYERVSIMGHNLWVMILLTVTSLLMALPFLLIVMGLKRYYRLKPIHCDNCGTKMHRLSEEEDNKYLNESQNLEEELNSVDYDVWLCDKCGTTEVFPFVNKHTKYEICPRCHTRASRLVKDTIVVQPTTTREGQGIKHYHCSYCGNNHQKRYKIPKREDTTNAALTAAAIGAGLSRGGSSGGGGGFSGGSWGGGSFGGGGASGGW